MAGFVRKILKSGLGIFTSRIFGMIRDVSVAGFFGASGVTDAFFVAFAVPNLFRAFFAEGALSSVFIPFLSDRLTHEGEKKASVYLTSLILAVSAVILILLSLVMLFPAPVVALFMPGYRADVSLMSSAASMIVVLMPYLLFITICSLLTCYLNLKGSYFVANSSTALLNIAMIGGAYFGYINGLNIMYLCYGVFIGGVLQLATIFIYTVKKGYRPSLAGGYDRSVNKVFYLILPSLAGVGINQLNFLIGRVIASFLAVGSISYLYYANRLFQFPLGMFAVAVGTVTLAEISSANSRGDHEQRNSLIDKAVNAIFLIMLPATAGLIILSDPIIRIVYGRMSFGVSDVASTASALRMYSAGLLFYSFISVFSRVFYSDKDVKTPVVAAFAGFVCNLALNLALMKVMGHDGIALASSIAAAVNCVWLYVCIKRYSYRPDALLIKIIAASAVMSVVIAVMEHININVIMTIIVGILVYFGSLLAVRVNIRGVLR